jgi:hypothetical protein
MCRLHLRFWICARDVHLQPFEKVDSFAVEEFKTRPLLEHSVFAAALRNIKNHFKRFLALWSLKIDRELRIPELARFGESGDELESLTSVAFSNKNPTDVHQDVDTDSVLETDVRKPSRLLLFVSFHDFPNGSFHTCLNCWMRFITRSNS